MDPIPTALAPPAFTSRVPSENRDVDNRLAVARDFRAGELRMRPEARCLGSSPGRGRHG